MRSFKLFLLGAAALAGFLIGMVTAGHGADGFDSQVRGDFFDGFAGNAAAPTHGRGELLFGLAEGWARAGDATRARGYFERLARELPGTPYAGRAAIWKRDGKLARGETGCTGCHTPSAVTPGLSPDRLK